MPLFAAMSELDLALESKAITLQTKIKALFETVDAEGNPVVEKVVTTPGRMLLSQILPKHHAVPFSLINKVVTKKEITNIIGRDLPSLRPERGP